MDLKEIASGVDPQTHWYYQSKKIPLLAFFNAIQAQTGASRLIDIGAGNGFFAEELCRQFPHRIEQALLIDQAYQDEELVGDNKQKILRCNELPETIGNATILLMDVLEHIEDDGQFLRELRKRSSPQDSNHFFITVPAFDRLWSGHDVYLGHHRRYTRQSLQQVLLANDFRVDRIYYIYNGFLPVAYLKRRITARFLPGRPDRSEMKALPGFLNKLLLRYALLEQRLLPHFKWFGLTCVSEGRF